MTKDPRRLYRVPDDFEATIRILRENEGGRHSAPFNGIRWDFAYEGDDISTTGIYMIYPDFINDQGESFPTDQPLPIDVPLPARMTVLVDEMRQELHRDRIQAGTRFYCHEGAKRVAEGVVTKITGLHKPRGNT